MHTTDEKATPLAISPRDQTDVRELYQALQKGKARLVGPDGESRHLPDSLYAFLVELMGLLNQGKSVYIVQNQSKLTTVEAAARLGVSRQFLVNLLEKGDIPYHMVGTHRRIYAQDLMKYKAKRDENRTDAIRELARKEAEEGIYDKVPIPQSDVDED